MASRLRSWLGIGLLGMTLAACDQPQERQERAEKLFEAVGDQIAGNSGGSGNNETARDRLAQASMAERALAGRVKASNEVDTPSSQSKFVIGSIIAKPREIAVRSTDGAVRVEGLERSAEPQERRILDPTERPRLKSRLGKRRPQEFISRSVPIEGELPSIPQRALEWKRPEEVQQRIDTRMQETMARFGLTPDIVESTNGEMMVRVKAPITRARSLRNDEVDTKALMPRFGGGDTDGCPDDLPQERIVQDMSLATECAVKALAESGEYEYVDKDFIFDHQFERIPPDENGNAQVMSAVVTPNDPLFSLQWHFQQQGEGVGQSLGGAGFADFWSSASNQGSRDIVVAVVDTGLQLQHPDIAGSPNVAAGFDMVSDERMGNDGNGRDGDPNDPGDRCDPTNPLQKDTFHGTHVAGTVGAATTNNAAGVAGGAWNVTIVPVRALGRCGGRLSDINDAIRWSAGLIAGIDENGDEIWNENPADIINLSLGLFEPCPASMQDAIDAAVDAGAIVVTAAGNARVNTRFYAPAGCHNVLSVAAGDALGQLAPYSNYGADVDLVAPGGDVTQDLDGDGRPDGVLSTKLSNDCYDPVTNANIEECYYAYEQGTSMAAPHVAAALALIKSDMKAHGDDNPSSQAVVDRLMGSLVPRTQMQCSGQCSFYPGTPEIEGQPGQCYRDCGEGLLNLASAVQR